MKVALITEKLAWHLEGWARVLGGSADVEKIVLADSSRQEGRIRQIAGDKLGAMYTSPEELLSANEVDLAVVTMAPIRMPGAVRAALEAGVPVIVEKPGAESPESYAPLVELANSKGLLLSMSLGVGAMTQEMMKIVSDGTLGRIYGMHYVWMDHQRWRVRDRMGWVYSKKEAGGGILGHLFCHGLHRIRLIMGEVAEVSGYADVVSGAPIDVEDSVAMSIRFASDAVGSYYAGSYGPAIWGGPGSQVAEANKLLPHTLNVWGEKGALHANMSTGTLAMDLQHHGPMGMATEPEEAGKGEPRSSVRRWESTISDQGSPMEDFFQGCLMAMRGEGKAPNSNEDGLRFLEFQHAFYRASETGKSQRLSELYSYAR